MIKFFNDFPEQSHLIMVAEFPKDPINELFFIKQTKQTRNPETKEINLECSKLIKEQTSFFYERLVINLKIIFQSNKQTKKLLNAWRFFN